MADLIDRKALLDNNLYDGCDVVYIDAIQNAPTVDAVPVVHGHWIERRAKRVCSVCGVMVWARSVDCTIKYCPNCGAKMDESGEQK